MALLLITNKYFVLLSTDHLSKLLILFQIVLKILSCIHAKYNIIIVTGDFNLHVDNLSDSLTKQFLELFSCVDFIQHVNFWSEFAALK